MSLLPKRPRGRPSAKSQARYEAELDEFCNLILRLRETQSLIPESRSWCYILEEHGLAKGDFDAAQRLVNDCRKDGRIPVDVVARDDSRATIGEWYGTGHSADEFADNIVRSIKYQHHNFTPICPHDYQDAYVEVICEKGDISKLFAQALDQVYVPVTPMRGWSDINSRADLIYRLSERSHKRCVLLVCTDLDPGGYNIANTFEKNLDDLRRATGWSGSVKIKRFALDPDFVDENGLSWIPNLETSSGQRLDDPRHPDHDKAYVQSYIDEIGSRKCELNALITKPDLAHELALDAVAPYIDADAIDEYEQDLEAARATAAERLITALRLEFGGVA